MELLSELRPEWPIWIEEGDVNLYLLGFLEDIPCSLNFDVPYEEIEKLEEEILAMEIGVYNEEELLYSNWTELTNEERQRKRELKKEKQQYERYSCLQALPDMMND